MASLTSRLSCEGLVYVKEFSQSVATLCSRVGVVSKNGQVHVFVGGVGVVLLDVCGGDPGQLVAEILCWSFPNFNIMMN